MSSADDWYGALGIGPRAPWWARATSHHGVAPTGTPDEADHAPVADSASSQFALPADGAIM
jgi:hypothetical protein